MKAADGARPQRVLTSPHPQTAARRPSQPCGLARGFNASRVNPHSGVTSHPARARRGKARVMATGSVRPGDSCILLTGWHLGHTAARGIAHHPPPSAGSLPCGVRPPTGPAPSRPSAPTAPRPGPSHETTACGRGCRLGRPRDRAWPSGPGCPRLMQPRGPPLPRRRRTDTRRQRLQRGPRPRTAHSPPNRHHNRAFAGPDPRGPMAG